MSKQTSYQKTVLVGHPERVNVGHQSLTPFVHGLVPRFCDYDDLRPLVSPNQLLSHSLHVVQDFADLLVGEILDNVKTMTGSINFMLSA